MKKLFLTVVAFACAAMVISCNGKGSKVTKGDESKLDTLSYALGENTGFGIKSQLDVNLDIDVVCEAAVATFKNKASQESEESFEILREFFSQTLPERKRAHEEAVKADSTLVFSAFESEAEQKKISYAFGNDMATNILDVNNPIQYYWFLDGFKDAWSSKGGNDLKVSQEQAQAFLQHHFMIVVPAEAAERSAKWLAKMEKKSGVQKTESGLLYKIVKKGDMTKVATNDSDIVKVHYVGRLQDGTVFDASRFEDRPKKQQKMIRQQMPTLFDEKGNIKEEKPAEIPLNQVIKGWSEGMKLVGPGGKIKLYVPAELAYGRRGAGNVIGPNEALEFEVEVLEVVVDERPIKAAKESAEWLEKKAAEEGVQKTESGLLYKVIKAGNMKKAAKNDNDEVEVHYTGRLKDGTVFDSSRSENNPNGGKPIKFPLNRVIKGWTEGMKLVGPGGKIELYIPAELAYGEQGAGRDIGPNEALQFEVELISVTPAKLDLDKK